MKIKINEIGAFLLALYLLSITIAHVFFHMSEVNYLEELLFIGVSGIIYNCLNSASQPAT